ncbi:MAG: hypothetical protein M3Q16_04505 [Pseudomonadota bacterium]|nr:hypothetical protein [Pseudomonadota bacterium]
MSLLTKFQHQRSNDLVGIESMLKPMEVVRLDGCQSHICRRGASTPILSCHTHLIVRADLANHLFELCTGCIVGIVADVKQDCEGGVYDGYFFLRSSIKKKYVVAKQNRLWNFQGGHLCVPSAVGSALFQVSRLS